jgi:hypothetical protein
LNNTHLEKRETGWVVRATRQSSPEECKEHENEKKTKTNSGRGLSSLSAEEG